jgi:hypothetical protein
MARPTAGQVKLQFEKRRKAWLRQKCEIPEVREAVAAIEREVRRRWQAGERVESPHPVGDKPTRNPLPFWFERAVCRRNGVAVRVEEKGKNPPIVHLSPTIEAEAEREDLTARLQHPQNLISPAEYDLWEIRRDAPLSRILEDVQYQWCALQEARASRGVLAERHKRGSSMDRLLRSLDMYRARLQGDRWAAIAARFRCHVKTAQRAVRDLCERFDLPPPRRGAVLPDAPTAADCPPDCAKRLGPAEPCPECPWRDYANSLEAIETKQAHRIRGARKDPDRDSPDIEDLGHGSSRKRPVRPE